MNRFRRVEDLFLEASDLSAEERAEFLDKIGANDPELRREVESLIACEGAADRFVSEVVGNATASFAGHDLSDRLGQQIGIYQLIREIGRGGMGTVYLARREAEFHQMVALKVLRRGLDTEMFLRRFHRERRILASLSHPNIAQIFDGGSTADGLPYFVMEYIQGEPIAAYCESRALPIEARLRLFQDICAAVHHAHQKLIIHRDIKSSNILVTADGIAKLLDFGLAKLVAEELDTDHPGRTAAVTRLMTPEYASPEQARGERLTTVTDVYSLGVLLHEMLTGQRPYRLSYCSPSEIERAICLTDPMPPSKAVPATDPRRTELAGDLDNIVLMAMRKEPSRRYGSADQLSADIDRYLKKLPVTARQDTFWYRAGKMVHRNKTIVVTVGLLIVSLLAGLISTMAAVGVARRERALAEKRFRDLRRLARSVLFELHDAIEPLPGSTAARGLLVKQSLEYLDNLSLEAGRDPDLQRELAIAYRRVGDVQGSRTMPNLGDTAAALQSYRKSLALCEQLLHEDPGNVPDRREAAVAYVRITSILQTEGNTAAALDQARKALAIRQEVAASDPTNSQYQADLASGHQDVGMVYSDREEWPAAIEHFRHSLAIRESLASTELRDAAKQRSRAIAYRRLGATLARNGQSEEALSVLRRCSSIEEQAVTANPSSTQARLDLSFTAMEIGFTLASRQDFTGALSHYDRARTLREAVVRDDPRDARARGQLGITCQRLGLLLIRTGRPEEALPHLTRAAALHRDLFVADPSSVVKQVQAAVAYADLGFGHQTLAERSRSASASSHWRSARTQYLASLDLQRELAARGRDHWLLHRPTHTHADQLEQRIATCDAALSPTGRFNTLQHRHP